uniref:Uncharacterized protein n=1 Tax=Rhizophora mucronata TaxID=61149 RepID=A0A2P2QYR3_RHIMU
MIKRKISNTPINKQNKNSKNSCTRIPNRPTPNWAQQHIKPDRHTHIQTQRQEI